MAQKLVNAKVTVATNGTRVQLTATPIYARSVYFEADAANSGKIYLGDALVSSTVYSRMLNGSGVDRDWAMEGDSQDGSGGSHRNTIDLSTIWVDASAAAQVVHYSYLAQQP